jgi:hypothetical protein
MLTENQIVSLLKEHLERKGYEVLKTCGTGDRGIDLIAQRKTHVLYIEAKGETSSKSHSSRFGKPFSTNQIKSHVSRAILTSMILTDDKLLSGTKKKVAIALPDNPGHRSLVEKISASLRTLKIKIYWVSALKITEH